MTLYDQALQKLEDSIPDYIKSVGEFQYQNQKWNVSNHDYAPKYDTCQICGHHPILERYYVTNTETQEKEIDR